MPHDSASCERVDGSVIVRTGRRIPLNVVILPATGPARAEDLRPQPQVTQARRRLVDP